MHMFWVSGLLSVLFFFLNANYASRLWFDVWSESNTQVSIGLIVLRCYLAVPQNTVCDIDYTLN